MFSNINEMFGANQCYAKATNYSFLIEQVLPNEDNSRVSNGTAASMDRAEGSISGETPQQLPDFWPGEETFADHPPVPTEFVVETLDGNGVFAVGNTVLIGTPKAGKSTFLYGGLIAGLTKQNGSFRIRGNEGRYSAAYVTAQEDPSGNISSLILGGDGNTKLVSFSDPAKETEGSLDPISDYLEQVDQKLTKCPDCKLVVTDTLAKLASALGFSINNANSVRKLLDGTQRLGEKHKVAFLWIHHLNKGDSRKSIDAKIAGSGQILASVRALWIFGTHPEDDQLRVLAYYRGNLVTVPNNLVCRRNEVPYQQVLMAAQRNHNQNAPFTPPPEGEKYYEVLLVDHSSVSAEELTSAPASKAEVEKEQEGLGWDDSLDDEEADGDEAWTEEASVESQQSLLPPAPTNPKVQAPLGKTCNKARKRRDNDAPHIAAKFASQLLARFNVHPETMLSAKEIQGEMLNAGLKDSWYSKLTKKLKNGGLQVSKRKYKGAICSVWYKVARNPSQRPSSPLRTVPPSSSPVGIMNPGYATVSYYA